MSLATGTRLGPYEILAPLGAGGMGEVYRARDTRLKRDVALKVLRAHLIQDADAEARFAREARAVAALSHQNILAIHDVGTAQGIVYAVMELLDGETLRARLRQSPIPWRKAVSIALQVADGLAAAHAGSIVHRDHGAAGRRPTAADAPRCGPELGAGHRGSRAFGRETSAAGAVPVVEVAAEDSARAEVPRRPPISSD